MAKSYTCKSCKKKSTKIGVASVCRQVFHIGSDSYTDTAQKGGRAGDGEDSADFDNIEETINGFCLECAHPIPAKALKQLTGLTCAGQFIYNLKRLKSVLKKG